MKGLSVTCLALLLFGILSMGLFPAAIGASQEVPARNSRGKTALDKNNAKAGTENEGEKKFQTHCGRCHNAPEQISPRIAGSVVRHMRVRAVLSAEDERQILQFLAP